MRSSVGARRNDQNSVVLSATAAVQANKMKRTGARLVAVIIEVVITRFEGPCQFSRPALHPRAIQDPLAGPLGLRPFF